MNNDLMFSSKKQTWTTPRKLFDDLNSVFRFTLDPCASKKSALCEKFYTKKEDGLLQSWFLNRAFVNPPYKRGILNKWVEKCALEFECYDVELVLLIPARTDTKYYHNYIFPKATAICFIEGRLKFGDGKAPAPFPSALIIYTNHLTDKQKKVLEKYGHLTVL